ncbi:hypothetical protein AAII07_53840 [Microvirga sp. 0TCS3.31]
MLGLIMMSVPLGLAAGLSVVALVWPESDGSAGRVEEDISARRQRDRRCRSPRQGARLTRRLIKEVP